MAYPAIDGPYGLIPINLVGGQVFAGATRQMPIGSGSTTAIYYGDVVNLGSDGTLGKDVGTSSATPVGVFLGCSYTDATVGPTYTSTTPARSLLRISWLMSPATPTPCSRLPWFRPVRPSATSTAPPMVTTLCSSKALDRPSLGTPRSRSVGACITAAASSRSAGRPLHRRGHGRRCRPSRGAPRPDPGTGRGACS